MLRRIRRHTSPLVTVAAGAAGAVLLAAGSSAAHVRVIGDVIPTKPATLRFRVPSEMADATTVRIAVAVPPELAVTSVPVLDGWTEKTVAGPAGLGTQVVWTAQSGHAIKPAASRTFTVKVGPVPDRYSLSFDTEQTYSNGRSVAWNEDRTGSGEAEFPTRARHQPRCRPVARCRRWLPATHRADRSRALRRGGARRPGRRSGDAVISRPVGDDRCGTRGRRNPCHRVPAAAQEQGSITLMTRAPFGHWPRCRSDACPSRPLRSCCWPRTGGRRPGRCTAPERTDPPWRCRLRAAAGRSPTSPLRPDSDTAPVYAGPALSSSTATPSSTATAVRAAPSGSAMRATACRSPRVRSRFTISTGFPVWAA